MEHNTTPTVRPGEETLTPRARALLDPLVGTDRYDEILLNFQELARPHPFARRPADLKVRLAGLPPLAIERSAHLDPARISGIHATSVYGSSHNFGSGGRTYTVYSEPEGAQSRLGIIYNANGTYPAESFHRPTTGLWVRVHPVGAHRGDTPWAYVWVDTDTSCGGIGISERGW